MDLYLSITWLCTNINVYSILHDFNHPRIDVYVNLTTLLTNSTSVQFLAYIISVGKQKMSTAREYLLVKIEIDPDLSVHNSGSLYCSSITGGWPTFTLVFCVV